jgi:hypothetical protein
MRSKRGFIDTKIKMLTPRKSHNPHPLKSIGKYLGHKNTTILRQKADQLQKIFQNRILLFQTILPLFRGITLGILPYLSPVPRADTRACPHPRLRPDGLIWG